MKFEYYLFSYVRYCFVAWRSQCFFGSRHYDCWHHICGVDNPVTLSWMMAQLRGSRDRVQATNVPKVGDLSSELRTVTDWHKLGIHLGLQTYELMQIERDHHGNERQKREMLDLWLRRKPDAGWRDVVSALEEMEENRVAESIRQNYVRGESTGRL